MKIGNCSNYNFVGFYFNIGWEDKSSLQRLYFFLISSQSIASRSPRLQASYRASDSSIQLCSISELGLSRLYKIASTNRIRSITKSGRAFAKKRLQSPNLDQKYIGNTEDLKNRLQTHSHGQSPYTAKFKPWELITYHTFKDRSNFSIQPKD